MTDLIKQTKKLVNRIEWQEVPEDLDLDDMCDFILDAIEHFYVMAGKSAEYSEDLVVLDEDGKPQYFKADFMLDEQRYILATAQLQFLDKVRGDLSETESYTTDAMSVTNGDKPFKNVTEMLNLARSEQIQMWHKMPRYNML